tara:strand:+ start:3949 stop:4416 length:468 start_codon:yes stop_codon:yes gene_type:complete
MEIHNILTPGSLFDSLVEKKRAFVKFYHDQCGHCNAMLPDWKRLETAFKNKKHDGHIISVHHDAIKGIKSIVKNNVNGYPTILEVLPGGIKGREFSGERSFEKLHAFAKNIFGNKQHGGRRTRNLRKSRKKKNKKSHNKRLKKSRIKRRRTTRRN